MGKIVKFISNFGNPKRVVQMMATDEIPKHCGCCTARARFSEVAGFPDGTYRKL